MSTAHLSLLPPNHPPSTSSQLEALKYFTISHRQHSTNSVLHSKATADHPQPGNMPSLSTTTLTVAWAVPLAISGTFVVYRGFRKTRAAALRYAQAGVLPLSEPKREPDSVPTSEPVLGSTGTVAENTTVP